MSKSNVLGVMVAAGLAALSVGLAGAAHASIEVLTLTNDEMIDPLLGSAQMTGTETFGPSGTTFDFTIQENAQGQMETYTWTSYAQDGEPSEIPPTPCIEYGCTGPVINGPVAFSLPYEVDLPVPYGDGLALTQFEDGVYDYSGYGTLTETFESGAPEPATWAMTLVGLSCLGGALRTHRRRRAAIA